MLLNRFQTFSRFNSSILGAETNLTSECFNNYDEIFELVILFIKNSPFYFRPLPSNLEKIVKENHYQIQSNIKLENKTKIIF